MGLDVSLVRCKDMKASLALEKEYEDKSEAIWKAVGNNKKYEELTQAEKDEASKRTKALAKELGLGEYGSDDKGKKSISKNSKKYPEHMFKIGYFRSSYNGGGINHVLSNMGLMDLYDIFDRNDKDDYYFQPNWKTALAKVEATIEAFKKEGNYRIFAVAENMFTPSEVKNEKEALDIFKKQMAQEHSFEGGYSNKDGEFYPKGLKVFGFVPGEGHFGKCTYVITEAEDNKWYLDALEITKETIEFVLKSKKPEEFYLGWSA